jgi:hypothetical protein
MKNTKNALIYGAAGGALGFGIAHIAKAKKHWLAIAVVAGVIVGGIVGNNS